MEVTKVSNLNTVGEQTNTYISGDKSQSDTIRLQVSGQLEVVVLQVQVEKTIRTELG